MNILIIASFFVIISTASGENNTISCPTANSDDQHLAGKLKSKKFKSTLSPFSVKLLKNIPSVGFFKKAFDVSFDPNEVAQVFYDNCKEFNKQLSSNEFRSVCDRVSKYAEEAFKKGLTSLDYFRIVSRTVERVFKSQDILTSKNEDSMINSFLKDVAKYLCSENVNGPVRALYSLSKGSEDFFKSLGEIDNSLSTDANIHLIQDIFADEFEKFSRPCPKCMNYK